MIDSTGGGGAGNGAGIAVGPSRWAERDERARRGEVGDPGANERGGDTRLIDVRREIECGEMALVGEEGVESVIGFGYPPKDDELAGRMTSDVRDLRRATPPPCEDSGELKPAARPTERIRTARAVRSASTSGLLSRPERATGRGVR